MTFNLFNPEMARNEILNIIKVVVLAVLSRPVLMIFDINALPSPFVERVVAYGKPCMRAAAIGSILPLTIGYATRKFEEFVDYTGRDGFDHPRQDLLKMSHYAFHATMMSGLSYAVWKLSKPLSEDIRVASVLSAIYFYAVGRACVIDPAESMLMMNVKYMPAICIAIVGLNRSPTLQRNMPIVSSVMGISGILHVIGFH